MPLQSNVSRLEMANKVVKLPRFGVKNVLQTNVRSAASLKAVVGIDVYMRIAPISPSDHLAV